MEQKKRRGIDKIIVIVVILIAAVLMIAKFYVNNRLAKNEALVSELRAVRTAVELYVVTNKKYPPDLKTLTTERYTVDGRSSFYLTGVTVDKMGYPMDSFGYRFTYDPGRGGVWPARRDYAGW